MTRFFAVLFGVLAAVPAHALSVTPITIEMTSAGKGARAIITISNQTSEPTAIEPSFERIAIGQDGSVTRETVTGENFLLLPLQSLLQPGTSQTFRLQWVGPPDIPQSESYFITFNQLPVSGVAKKQGLVILTGFSVAVNVSPLHAVPVIDLVSTDVARTKGKAHPAITVQNPSACHALLKHATVTINADGTTFTLHGHNIEETFGNGLLQPWSKRRFVLPIDLPPNTDAVTASITYRPPAR